MKKRIEFIAEQSSPCPMPSCEYGKIWELDKEFCDEHIQLLKECDIGLLEQRVTANAQQILEDEYPSLRPIMFLHRFQKAMVRTKRIGIAMIISGMLMLTLGIVEDMAGAVVGVMGGGAITFGLLKLWSIKVLENDAHGNSNGRNG